MLFVKELVFAGSSVAYKVNVLLLIMPTFAVVAVVVAVSRCCPWMSYYLLAYVLFQCFTLLYSFSFTYVWVLHGTS